MNLRRALSTSAVILLARFGGAGIGFATQVLLAHVLLPEGLGTFFLATSIAAVAGMLAAAGYPTIIVGLVARYRERARPDLLAAFVRQARRETLLAAAILALLISAAPWCLPGLDGETRIAISLAAISVPASALIRVDGCLASAIRQFELSWLPDLLLRPVLFLSAVAPLALAGRLSVTLAVAIYSGVSVIVTLAQAAWMRAHFPPAAIPPRLRRLGRHWRSTSRPLVLVTLFVAIFADIDLAIVGLFVSKADLAIFGVCLKLAFLAGFAVQILQEFAAPDLAEGFTRRDPGMIQRALVRANGLAVLGTLAATLAAFLFGDLVLRAFGPDFAQGRMVLVILLASLVVRAAFGPSTTLLMLAGAHGRIATAYAFTFAVLVISNAVLAPWLGSVGAALAVVATTVFWNLGLALVLHRQTGLRADIAALPAALRGARSLLFER